MKEFAREKDRSRLETSGGREGSFLTDKKKWEEEIEEGNQNPSSAD